MENRIIGIYEYQERFPDNGQEKLPQSMQLSTASNEAILLRLLLGQIRFKKSTGSLVEPQNNFMLLPAVQTESFTDKAISDVFSNSGDPIDVVKANNGDIEKYFQQNRKNHDIHEKVLFEISNYFSSQEYSPIEAFTHLYRCLEFVAYSFPMIYAGKSKNYKGTFSALKKFFSGDPAGELKFFCNFLDTLYDDEKTVLDYKFEIDLKMSYPITALEKELHLIYKRETYEIESEVLSLKFKDMADFFVTTRNRFFHMLVGQGQGNFCSNEYDIGEYFDSINPHILNWLSMIIQKITIYGFYSSLN